MSHPKHNVPQSRERAERVKNDESAILMMSVTFDVLCLHTYNKTTHTHTHTEFKLSLANQWRERKFVCVHA